MSQLSSAPRAVDWIELHEAGGATVLKLLPERLNPTLHRRADFIALIGAIAAEGAGAIVVDVASLNYTNHAWGVLQLAFSAAQAAQGTPCRLAFSNLRGHPRRAYLFANADRYIPEYQSTREALSAIAGIE